MNNIAREINHIIPTLMWDVLREKIWFKVELEIERKMNVLILSPIFEKINNGIEVEISVRRINEILYEKYSKPNI